MGYLGTDEDIARRYFLLQGHCVSPGCYEPRGEAVNRVRVHASDCEINIKRECASTLNACIYQTAEIVFGPRGTITHVKPDGNELDRRRPNVLDLSIDVDFAVVVWSISCVQNYCLLI